MDHPVAGHATPPLQAQMDPYRDPPRLVFKSSESQLEEIKKLNTEKFEKYFTADQVQGLYFRCPPLSDTDFLYPQIQTYDVFTNLQDLGEGNHFSHVAAQVIAHIAKGIDPSPSVAALNNCALAMKGLREKTWKLISKQPDNQFDIIPKQ